jgi:hypothetical protein
MDTVGMLYEGVDRTINEWASENSLTLFTAWPGGECRACYTSSPQGECFQISIEPPTAGNVGIDARSIETLNDEELHERWSVAVGSLRNALEIWKHFVTKSHWATLC